MWLEKLMRSEIRNRHERNYLPQVSRWEYDAAMFLCFRGQSSSWRISESNSFDLSTILAIIFTSVSSIFPTIWSSFVTSMNSTTFICNAKSIFYLTYSVKRYQVPNNVIGRALVLQRARTDWNCSFWTRFTWPLDYCRVNSKQYYSNTNRYLIAVVHVVKRH